MKYCKIVAEVGSNWSSLEDCLASITKAKECGADAVKFQLYDYKSLYGLDAPIETKDGAFGEYEKRKELPGTLPVDWLPKLKEQADNVGIEFMCTAFSVELLDKVDPYVKIHKVASAEMLHVGMLKRLRRIGKPVYLSTGAHTVSEIDRALAFLTQPEVEYHWGESAEIAYEIPPVDVTLMYCTASYPAKYSNTYNVKLYRKLFSTKVGFSDHTLDVYEAPINAIENGAVVIEKHVNFVNADGPDAPHSLNTEEFKDMVHALMGEHTKNGPTPDEAGMLSQHNRRLIATKDIAQGEEFVEGLNYGFYRSLKPCKGLSPLAGKDIAGKRCMRPVQAGDAIE